MMAVDQDHSVQGSTVVAVIEEEPSGSTILGAMSTMSTVIAEQEKEQEMDGCRAKLAAATESKTESVPKTEESLSCQGIPAETCRPPPSKVHAGNDEPVIAGAEGDGQPQRRVSKEDFQLLKVIGMGAFGKVLQSFTSAGQLLILDRIFFSIYDRRVLIVSQYVMDLDDTIPGRKGSSREQVLKVRSRRSGQILAMKCISKKMLERRNHMAYMQAERDIMTKVSHPFVVALQCAFQTESKLFLVMEYLPGGELFFHLSKKGLFSEEYARFYAAEMVLAVEHLHSKGIIHRDLKPENLLLGANGHICVTDFGLAKELSDAEDEGLKTICGTNEYMAPEMILRKGYGKAVDWWSMGALVYEMTSGYPPFQGKTPKDLNRKILNERVSLPKWLSSGTHQVLRGFLERNVSRRLGAQKTTMFEIGGATAVKHHPFFNGIDWAKLIALQVKPPLKPELVSTTDTSNFCSDFVQMTVPRSLSEESLISDPGALGFKGGQGGMFRGFSFVADTFVDDEDWRSREHVQDCVRVQGTVAEVENGPLGGDIGKTELTPPKVKGKRVRNKKGKGKGSPAGVVPEDFPKADAGKVEQGDAANCPRNVPDESRGEENVRGGPREAPSALDLKKTTALARAPVREVESESKPSTLAAILAKQHQENPDPTPSGPRRANVWGVSELPAPASVPIPSGQRRAVAAAESKPSALATMLAKQTEDFPPLSTATTPGPRRANVWGASRLPAPAPVPIPSGPPRANIRYPKDSSASTSRSRPSANDSSATSGRLEGNTFVWKRPV